MSENFDERAHTWDDDPKKLMRSKAVADGILQVVPSNGGLRAFELGCGTGTLALMLQPHCHSMVLADTSEGMLQVLDRKIEQAGITNITIFNQLLTGDNLPKQPFDLVFTQMTLHHVADFKGMLELFHRMLEPGGWLCIADLDREDGSFHGKDFDGHHGFDRQELEMVAAGVGFVQVGFSTIFEMIKPCSDGVERKFPLFLMSCQKNGVN